MNFMYFMAILIGPLVKILYSFIGNYAVTMEMCIRDSFHLCPIYLGVFKGSY